MEIATPSETAISSLTTQRCYAPFPGADERDVILFGEVLYGAFPGGRGPGGGPFNVACHLRAFGLTALLISRAGRDAAGVELMARMRELGLDTRGIQWDRRSPTGRVAVRKGAAGPAYETAPGQAYDFIDAGLARLVSLSVRPRVLYFGTLAQRNPASRRALRNVLRHATVPRFVDVNLHPPWYDAATVHRSLTDASLVKVNERELFEIGRLLRFGCADASDLAATLMRAYGIERLV